MVLTDAKGQADIAEFGGMSDIIFRLYGYELWRLISKPWK